MLFLVNGKCPGPSNVKCCLKKNVQTTTTKDDSKYTDIEYLNKYYIIVEIYFNNNIFIKLIKILQILIFCGYKN